MLPIIIVSLSLIFTVSGQNTACDLHQFSVCQATFATNLGIPGADWHNPTALILGIQQDFVNGLPAGSNGLVGVCNAYNAFIQCLGPMAPSCLNPLFLLANDNTPENAFGYISTLNALGFDCGAGFYPGINNWGCIQRVYMHYNDTLFGCVRTFINHVFNDPDNACDYLQTALNCLTLPFMGICPPSGKWFGCETWRVYLTTRFYTCPAQCSLSTLKIEQDYMDKHPEWKNVKPNGAQ